MTVATILPNGRTVFLDANNNPLAGGFVYMYVPPNTTTPKTTWQDATGAVTNANPIVLDGDGSCLLYGSGQYLQEVYDSASNLVYTALTQDTYGLIVAGNNIFTGNNTFSGTNTFSGGFVLPSNYVTNAMLDVMQPNTVKLNGTAGLASPTDFGLTASTLLGRGSSGNIAKITLGTNLSMSGAVLNGPSSLSVVARTFTVSSTYTPTTGMKYCIVQAIGGGGGGSYSDTGAAYGLGGAAGGYSSKLCTAADIGASQSVTIGAAGTAGTVGNGGNGGNTTFGAILTCNGGTGGTSGNVGRIGVAGGTASGGDININGANSATIWNTALNLSGAGANSQWGIGGQSASGAVGAAASGFGAGGSGSQGTTPRNGAVGTAGKVYIIEFIQT